MNGFDLANRIVSYIRAVFDYGHRWAAPIALASELSNDLFNKSLSNVNPGRLFKYRDNLLGISNDLNNRISVLNQGIESLRGINSLGLHNQEIIGRTMNKWDLQNQLVPVSIELNQIYARFSKGFIFK